MRHAMIMAGGAGTRLWPMSRRDTPKQLIKFIQSRPGQAPRSLLELAAARLVWTENLPTAGIRPDSAAKRNFRVIPGGLSQL